MYLRNLRNSGGVCQAFGEGLCHKVVVLVDGEDDAIGKGLPIVVRDGFGCDFHDSVLSARRVVDVGVPAYGADIRAVSRQVPQASTQS